MNTFSIKDNVDTILKPNSEFERRIILQYYLDNDIEVSNFEKEILNQAIGVEPESIGIIGCLLNDKSQLNTLRLAIGVKNKSNKKLAQLSKELLETLNIEKAALYFMIDKDFNEMNEVEIDVDKVYNQIYYS